MPETVYLRCHRIPGREKLEDASYAAEIDEALRQG
jgi:hypothetical protein